MREKILGGLQGELPGYCIDLFIFRDICKVEMGLFYGLFQDISSEINAFTSFLIRYPLSDLGLGARGLDEIEPIFARVLVVGCYDLHHIAVFKYVSEGNHPAVNPGPAAFFPDFGMDAVGDINRGCALRELLDLSLWRKDIDLVREQVHP